MFLIDRSLKLFHIIEKIQLRMMLSTFSGNSCTTILYCYSSTNASDETDLITLYNELSSLVRSIINHKVLIINGGINIKIGKKENN